MNHEDGSLSTTTTTEEKYPQNDGISSSKQDEDDIRNNSLRECSRGALSVRQDATQGSFVVANRALQPGEVLVECPSASIALDPIYRYTHCGFCASTILPKPSSNSNSTTTAEDAKPPVKEATTNNGDSNTPGTPCQGCQIVTICHDCHDQGVTEWHSQNGECRILRTLVESFQQVFSEFEGLSFSVAAQNVESIYVLTMRLLNRRQQQQQQTLACSLSDINWKLFDSLYASPLPSSAGASGIVTAMATLLQVMQVKLQQKQKNQQATTFALSLDSQTCISIWNKCRGCCHAITDLSRPLGTQNLGMALFVPQSFYNHACAPNAFLSCLLVSRKEARGEQTNDAAKATATSNYHHCAVISRVVCCSEQALETGESVTLSYIPLSSLCRAERRMRLRQTYHFTCQCKLCHDIATVGADGFVLEQHVGGEFTDNNQQDEDRILSTLGPLRELQIDCYQKLTQASKMETPDVKISGEVDSGDDDGSDEEDPRMDLIEQSVSTLQMAQRGIRNHKIMASHEVSLECHRLLAVAYSFLREGKEGWKEATRSELEHHRQFFLGVEPARSLLDPSALAIQHSLMVECLRAKMEFDEVSNNGSASDLVEQSVKTQLDHHVATAKKIAGMALGKDHPFGIRLEAQLDNLSSSLLSKKRKLST